MTRTLLVTNDYPPRIGGIQSYLHDFVSTQGDEITVFAPSDLPGVIQWRRPLMVPTPGVAEAMRAIIQERGIETVWFGASAPLGLLAGAAREAGASRVVASTHGHEVGWSMVPGARQALRYIGNHVDALTYVSEYARRRIAPAFGERPDYVHLPSGVDTEFFRPGNRDERHRFGFDDRPLIVCVSRLVSRKGQDQLIRVLPEGAQLAIVGRGPAERKLRELAGANPDVRFLGALEREDMRDLLAAAEIAAMPARTRGGGLDVEGLGIVYLEAQACGVPVIVGNSGGAPETVRPDAGIVVSGRRRGELRAAIDELLADPERRAAMGAAGRAHMIDAFSWNQLGRRLAAILSGL